jgi:hypothetical protein
VADHDGGGETPAEALDGMYDALTHGREDWIDQRVLRGPTSIHVGMGGGYWMDGDELVALLRRQFGEVRLTWAGGNPVIDQRGDVAWAVDRPVVAFDDGSALAARVSVVFVRDGMVWRLAHTHVSLGSD